MLLNPYISFPAAGAGGGLTIPASAVLYYNSKDLVFSASDQSVTGYFDPILSGEVTDKVGTPYGLPNFGVNQAQEQLTAGITIAAGNIPSPTFHIAVAYRLFGEDTSGVLLGSNTSSIHAGFGLSGNGSSADSNTTWSSLDLNGTTFSGSATRAEIWTNGMVLPSPPAPESLMYFAYENFDPGAATYLMPLNYVQGAGNTGAGVTPAYLHSFCIYTDSAETANAIAAVQYQEPEDAAFRYWRINVTEVNGDAERRCMIRKIEYKSSDGTVLTDPTDALTHSFMNNCEAAANGPALAFDGSASTYAYMAGNVTAFLGDCIVYDFGSGNEPAITSVDITNFLGGLAPQNFTIDKSKDCINWTNVRSITGETAWGTGETRSFDLTSPFSP